MRDEDLDSGMKREVYEMLDQLETHEAQTAQTAEGIDLEAGRSAVADALPEIGQLNKETQTMLSVAESMQQSESASNLSVARNVCFSYSFAVENEVKKRINKKVNRLLSGKNIYFIGGRIIRFKNRKPGYLLQSILDSNCPAAAVGTERRYHTPGHGDES